MPLYLNGKEVSGHALDVEGFEPGVNDPAELHLVDGFKDKDLVYVESLDRLFRYEDTSTASDDGGGVLEEEEEMSELERLRLRVAELESGDKV